jgi:hypothetical protein
MTGLTPEPASIAPRTPRASEAQRRPEPRSHAERARLACEIVAAYALARREMRRGPIAATVAALRSGRTQPLAQPTPEMQAEARRLGYAVMRLLSVLPGDTRCLARSLVLTRLLAKRGIAAKLVIGARAEPSFLAHAWVECEGRPVLPPGDGSYGRLVEL